MSKMRIVLATLLALAVASPALAVDVTWKGDFNNRFMYSTQADLAKLGGISQEGVGLYYNETNAGGLGLAPPVDTHKRDHDSDFFGEVKYRLWVTASDDEKKVKGVTAFEFGATKFGQAGSKDPLAGNKTFNGLDFGGDDNNFELRWAYVDFEVPFDPSSRLSVGLQPVGYNKFLWNDNAAGVKWSSKRGAFGYSLGWWRNDVNNGGIGGDPKLENDDVYAIDLTYAPVPTGRLNVFYLFREDGQETIADAGVGGADVDDSMDQTWWLGVAGEGQIENIFFGGTFIYMGGEVKAGSGPFENALGQTSSSWDKGAWLLNAEVTAKLDTARLRLGWLYSTGDDDENDTDLEGFQNIDAYMGYFGSAVLFDSFADDNTLVVTPYLRNKGLNMPYITVDVDVTEKASVGASYLWVNSAEDLDGPDLGTDGDTALGHEIAARASYKVAKGMTVGLQAGYLVGGNAWDEFTDPDPLDSGHKDGDNVFRADASVRYKF